jgi:hypothetical protein
MHLTVFAQEEATKIKKLSSGSEVIVTGKVTIKKSSWNESKTKIFTRATVQIEEHLKGADGESFVEIIYPGGEVGEIGEIYSHMPSFEEKEEVLVFLQKDKKDEEYKVLYGEEGKISILSDSKSKDKITSLNIPLKDLKSQIKKYITEK